jgi:porin
MIEERMGMAGHRGTIDGGGRWAALPGALASAVLPPVAAAILAAGSASAQTPASPAASAAAPANAGAGPFGSLTDLSTSSTLFGDMGGLRPFLGKYGVTFQLQEQSDVLGNVTGGKRRGFDYEGETTATLQIDTKPAFGLAGGLFNVSALQIHGRQLTVDNLLTIQGVSGIDGDSATRLWELWYQQKMFDDKVDIKIGQQSIDQEFMLSQSAQLFINNSFGWNALPGFDMPAGGPVSPLSALGVRVNAHLTDSVTLLAGVFNGSPVADNSGDPQKRNPSGISFPLNGGALAIAELQFASPAAGADDKPKPGDPLPYAYKIGAWYDSEGFADLRFDTAGAPLASPASNGLPAIHRGDYAFYALADQMIYRSQDDPDRSVSVFIRPTFTPLQDRNLIAFSLNAGVTMKEPLAGRKNDTFGVGVDFASFSGGAKGFDLDTASFNPGVVSAVRRNETVFEATYQYQVAPWWQIQPDFQYVVTPGGGIVNPDNPSQKVKNETVLGVRTTITF